MKKYIKPELVYESFELSQQIAACTYDAGSTANDISCAFTGTNPETGIVMTIFLEATTLCTVKAHAYCEHTGSGANFNIFNS